MAKLSKNAQKLFDYLPKNGNKVGGITLQKVLKLSKVEYMRAREELKEQELVESGRGRGGSLGRVKGAKPQSNGPSPVERAAIAREAKQAKTEKEKDRDELMKRILKFIHKEGFPQVSEKDVSFSDGRPIFAAWDNNGKYAKMYGIPQLEFDKLRAR